MNKTDLEKRSPTALKEKGQYALAFGVIALMLYVVGFPVLILVFFGALSFFVWRAITGSLRTEARPIFEFYLLANEILRDDGRRWFGFEIKDTIERGEAIVRSTATAPPLVHFAVGALYERIDDHTLAIKHLAESIEGNTADERSIVFPTPELRDYVRLLRKIERAPAESPQTSAAIRSLERMRKNRGAKMLELSRATAAGANVAQLDRAPELRDAEPLVRSAVSAVDTQDDADTHHSTGTFSDRGTARVVSFKSDDDRPPAVPRRNTKVTRTSHAAERKTISEVLHDIYDEQTG